MVLVGIGAVPNTSLADDAGLTVNNGIVVDEYLATDDEQISRSADCTSCPNRFAGGRPTPAPSRSTPQRSRGHWLPDSSDFTPTRRAAVLE